MKRCAWVECPKAATSVKTVWGDPYPLCEEHETLIPDDAPFDAVTMGPS